MKFRNYAMMAAATVMFAACSSEEPMAVNPDQPQGASNTFINIGLNLSGRNMGRAVEFDYGTSDENTVKNVNVYVFKTVGSDAVMVATGSSTEVTPVSKTENGVAVDVSLTNPIELTPNFDVTEGSYKVLVIANLDETKITAPTPGTKFSDWATQPQNQTDAMNVSATSLTDKGFVMTNGTAYGEGTPYTLVDVTTGSLVNGASPSATTVVYVQRNVAKVNVSKGSLQDSDLKDVQWLLDITNKSTYPVMNVTGINWAYPWMYQTGSTEFNRVYWAKDPNYDNVAITTSASDNFNVATSGSTFKNIGTTVSYCLENTFDIDHQYQGQTTRVVLKGKYNNGESFVWLKGQKYDYTTLTSAIKAQIEKFYSAANVTVKDAPSASTADLKIADMFTITGATVDWPLVLSQAELAGCTGETAASYYKDGECYYVVRIKHNILEAEAEKAWLAAWKGEEYAASDLGRYGVVRNNSYDIVVDGVKGPGSVAFPTVTPDEIDDPVVDEEQPLESANIKVQIKVLAWAKRTQNVTLQ